ncbi:MAG: electron transport complex subunit E [Erysipelotrichaceae bacterium]
MKNLMSGFFKENPVLVLYLGICSALAISTSLDNAIGMGVAVIVVLIMSNTIISLLRKFIPDEIRIPVYIVVIATLVKACEMLIHAYLPSLYEALGVFISLIVVNCIILGRAEAFASKNGVVASILDGLSMGLGYTFTLVLISGVRQILGTGALSLSNPLTSQVIFDIQLIPAGYEIGLFTTSAGAFITFALFAALFGMIKDKLAAKEKGAK